MRSPFLRFLLVSACCRASYLKWHGAHMAHRFSARQSSGVWFRWATVSVRRWVSKGSPGFRHCFPQRWHTHPQACFFSKAIRFQSAGYLSRSIGMAQHFFVGIRGGSGI